jgi:hypothetical protein
MVLAVYTGMMGCFWYCNHLLRQGQLRRKRRRIQSTRVMDAAQLTRQIMMDLERQGACSLAQLQRARVFRRSQV